MFFEAVLPSLVLLLVIVAALERVMRWAFGVKRSGRSIAAVGFEELNSVYQGTNRHEIEQREADENRREDDSQSAPPGRIDFTTASIKIRKTA